MKQPKGMSNVQADNLVVLAQSDGFRAEKSVYLAASNIETRYFVTVRYEMENLAGAGTFGSRQAYKRWRDKVRKEG